MNHLCNATPRTCILCRHLSFNAGQESFSECTPGYAWTLECTRCHFSLSGNNCNESEYQATLLKADTCVDFEKADLLSFGLVELNLETQ